MKIEGTILERLATLHELLTRVVEFLPKETEVLGDIIERRAIDDAEELDQGLIYIRLLAKELHEAAEAVFEEEEEQPQLRIVGPSNE